MRCRASSLGWLLPLACLVMAGLLLSTGHAQDGKKRGFALLVGVRQYDHVDLDPLRYTEKDAEELTSLIDRPGSPFHGNVRLLTTTRGQRNKDDAPTAANIRKALEKLVAGRTRDDLVLVALSGHGVQLSVPDPTGKGKDKSYGYFCSADADLVRPDYETGRHPRLVLLADMFDDLGSCGAGAKLVLMDACRNELKARARSLKVSRDLVPDGVAALLSCRPGQVAYEAEKLGHGVFFYHVLRGLKGEAKNRKGEVTWNALADYVAEAVPAAVKDLTGDAEQTPHEIKNLAGRPVVLLSVGESQEGKGGSEKVVQGWGKDVKNSIGMKLVHIPPGTFKMGSPKSEQNAVVADNYSDGLRGVSYPAEGPQHQVKITRAFWLGVYEVSQHEFKEIMGYNPSHFSKDGKGKAGLSYHPLEQPAGGRSKVPEDTSVFPVENVSSHEANEFCAKLSRRVEEVRYGRKYRLPTEAEWEYACRGGSRLETAFHFGPSLSSGKANFRGTMPFGGADEGSYLGRTCKIGSYDKNHFGLFDMHGNVDEWCSDRYDPDYYRKSPAEDPQGPSEGSSGVIRGGCWRAAGRHCRSAFRWACRPEGRMACIGFRVALVPSGTR
jgi:formylglycine-generating enzyme required for sulfatase activity